MTRQALAKRRAKTPDAYPVLKALSGHSPAIGGLARAKKPDGLALSGIISKTGLAQLAGLLRNQSYSHQTSAILISLQQRVGNRAMQDVFAETPFFPAHLEPRTSSDEEDLEELGGEIVAAMPTLAAIYSGKGWIAAAPPDPSKAGGAVVCKKGGFDIWINPSEPAAVKPCIRKHEEKHVADFQASSDYKNICKGKPDGDVVTYKNCDDTVRFEDAATTVEIDCLNNAIAAEKDPAKKAIMEQRRDKDIPRYRKQYRSCKGC